MRARRAEAQLSISYKGVHPIVLKIRLLRTLNKGLELRLRRVILEPAMEGRLRLDAATWGTMGVGLGYAIAAATTRPERLVVAVEGDSAFGFSGMECETIAR